MKRTPLDGRRWNTSARQDIKQTTTVMATLGGTGSDRTNLREASPPKKNPWQKTRQSVMTSVVESHNEDFPLPLATVGASAQGTVAATPTNTTASVAGSRRSSSRTSSFSSPDVGIVPSPQSRTGWTRSKERRQSPRSSPAVSQPSPYPRQAAIEPLEPVPDLTPDLTPTSPSAVPKHDETDAPSLTGSDRSLTNLDSLWKNPVGADVHVRTLVKSFFVHRDIVTSQSGWFRDNTPPIPSVCNSRPSLPTEETPLALWTPSLLILGVTGRVYGDRRSRLRSRDRRIWSTIHVHAP